MGSEQDPILQIPDHILWLRVRTNQFPHIIRVWNSTACDLCKNNFTMYTHHLLWECPEIPQRIQQSAKQCIIPSLFEESTSSWTEWIFSLDRSSEERSEMSAVLQEIKTLIQAHIQSEERA